MAKIVTLTMNPALDKSAAVSSVIAEHKMRCGEPSWQPGGGGINVARMVQRMGSRPLAVFPLGGHTGEFFQQLLLSEELEILAVPIKGMLRESLAVYEEATSQQYRFNFPGPTLSENEQSRCIAALAEELESDGYLVLSGSLPPGVPPAFYGSIVETANKIGTCVLVDSSGDALLFALKAGVFLIKPNLRELNHYAGRVLEKESEREALVKELVDTGRCQVAVVSLGAAGVMLVTADDIEYIRAPIVPIRSKVGAGDSMVGGIVWSLAEGHSLAEAVRYGVAAGSACVMTAGTELAYREDVIRLFEALQSDTHL